MSGLADLAQSLINTVASDLASDFKASVTLKPWISSNGDGDESYGTPVTLQALVDRTVKQYYTGDGKLVQTMARLTILDPVASNGASGRREPIDPRDVFTLDDGATAPIVQLPQFENPATGKPFILEVVLGRVLQG